MALLRKTKLNTRKAVGTFFVTILFVIIWEFRRTRVRDVNYEDTISRISRTGSRGIPSLSGRTQVQMGTVTDSADNWHKNNAYSDDRVPAGLGESRTNTGDSGTLSIPECEGSFFIPEDYSMAHCHVPVPEGYEIPYNRNARLWKVPRANLGELNTSEHDYHNQIHDQKWLRMEDNTVVLNENGGTSMRNFKTNFNYFDILVKTTALFSRCQDSSKPVILDTGAGVASLAASAIDENGGNATISVISYVPIDNYLRLGSIISDRGLPIFLHWFTGAPIPVPSESFDVVHCRWCWHHVVGYDLWLEEMNRIIVPGGAFVFTFVPPTDQELLPDGPWYEALSKMPWDCNRYSRIMQVCIKRNQRQQTLPCSYKEELSGYQVETVLNQTEKASAFVMSPGVTWHPQMLDRVLNMNCQDYKTCGALEETWGRRTTMNTFNKTEKGEMGLRRLLQGGSIGLLHDFSARPGPFYPRFFDVINWMCGIDDELSSKIIFETHRLLRPDGFLVVIESGCAKFDGVLGILDEELFHVIFYEDGVLVAKKLAVSK